jgi:integrase
MRTAANWDYVLNNPLRGVEMSERALKRPRRFLPAKEVRRLVAASQVPTLTIILPATTTGLRISEILALRWERIPRWRRRSRSLRMLAQRTTFLYVPPNSSPLAFLASHVLRFSHEHHFIATSERLFECSRPSCPKKSLQDTGNSLAYQSKPQFEQTALLKSRNKTKPFRAFSRH